MEATLSLNKVLTVITDHVIYGCRFSEFEKEASRYTSIVFRGYFSVAKYYRYVRILESLGFKESGVLFMGYNGRLVDFKVRFKKETN